MIAKCYIPFNLATKEGHRDWSKLLIFPMVFVYCTMKNTGVIRTRGDPIFEMGDGKHP